MVERLPNFQKYSKDFRQLSLGDARKISQISQVMLLQISNLDSGLLFPDVVTLRVIGDWLTSGCGIMALTDILNPIIKKIDLYFPENSSTTDVHACLNAIVRKVPNLESLKLYSVSPPNLLSMRLSVGLLQSLRSLQSLDLTTSWVTPILLGGLKSMPSLGHLSITSEVDEMTYCYLREVQDDDTDLDDNNGGAFIRLGSQDGFYKLSKIFMSIDFKSLPIFVRDFLPRSAELKNITLHVSDTPTPEFFLLIPRAYENLQTLDIRIKHHIPYFVPNPMAGTDVVHLSRCRMLTSLLLDPVFLEDQELHAVLANWPNLLSLSLHGPDPYDSFENAPETVSSHDLKGLSLDSLRMIGETVPKIQTLSLSIKATPTNGLGNIKNAFRSLRSLSLLYSFLNYEVQGFDQHEAAKFLSSLVDQGAEFVCVEMGELPRRREGDEVYLDPYDKFAEGFTKLVNSYVDIRRDERGRV